MAITTLLPRPELEAGSRTGQQYDKLRALVAELERRGLPEEPARAVSREVETLNGHEGTEKAFARQLQKAWNAVLKVVREGPGWVPRNYHRNTWMALGLAVFGVPLGVTFGLSLGSMAFLGIGFPIGLAIGLALGAGLDQKAAEQGKQLDVDY